MLSFELSLGCNLLIFLPVNAATPRLVVLFEMRYATQANAVVIASTLKQGHCAEMELRTNVSYRNIVTDYHRL